MGLSRVSPNVLIYLRAHIDSVNILASLRALGLVPLGALSHARPHLTSNSSLKSLPCCTGWVSEEKLTDWSGSCAAVQPLCLHYPILIFHGVFNVPNPSWGSNIHGSQLSHSCILVHAAWTPCCVWSSDLSAWLCAHGWGGGGARGAL